MSSSAFQPRLPVGTQVIMEPRGKTGVIKEILETNEGIHYSVIHPDGSENICRREELKIRKHVQAGAVGPYRDQADLFAQLIPKTVVYKCVIGSRAYGLATDDSDTDVRGVFVAPSELLWSLQGTPDHLELGENEEIYWELSHFCVLGLKANPNILECLHSPLLTYTNEVGQALLSLRQSFLSRLVHQTYNGYVLSQFKKIEQDIRNSGGPKWKHVMHLLRLLQSGTKLIKDGVFVTDVEEERENLLAVRRGEVPWEEVEAWRLRLQKEFDKAIDSSPLPELPDYQRIESFIIDVRRNGVLT